MDVTSFQHGTGVTPEQGMMQLTRRDPTLRIVPDEHRACGEYPVVTPA